MIKATFCCPLSCPPLLKPKRGAPWAQSTGYAFSSGSVTVQSAAHICLHVCCVHRARRTSQLPVFQFSGTILCFTVSNLHLRSCIYVQHSARFIADKGWRHILQGSAPCMLGAVFVFSIGTLILIADQATLQFTSSCAFL
jgi:hypothetical protein